MLNRLRPEFLGFDEIEIVRVPAPTATKFAPISASAWTKCCLLDARERGYQVVFTWERDTLTAQFYNGEFWIEDREWHA